MATIVIDSWYDVNLNVNPNATAVKTLCPSCSETRKHKRDKCLSVNPQKGVANCKNCGDIYVIRSENKETISSKEYKTPDVKQLELSAKTIDFFKGRGIEERVLEYFKVTESMDWMYGSDKAREGVTQCINFNYYDDHNLINVKFRASGKRFKLSTGSKLIFYNLNAIKNSETCFIVEGEIDAMSAYQCDIFDCVSVPNGASKGNQRLEYLDNCIDYFIGKKKIIIGTDGDSAGMALRDELIRRLGRDICWVIEYPEGTKDTNEVLLKYGEARVKQMIADAKQLPIEGVVEEDELDESVNDIWLNGYPVGDSVGYRYFDDLISFSPGQVTLWTGIPGHGKSEFIDQVNVRLAARKGWRFGIFAPENEPSYQAAALISKFVGGEMTGIGKIKEMMKDRGLKFVKENFYFMKVDEIDITPDGILNLARELIVKKGINALVIDPYNHIEHNIPAGLTETLYISKFMSKLKWFAKLHSIAIFLVAHPTKMSRDKDDKFKVPTLNDISGSSNWFAKTYNGISIYRDYETNIVTAYVQKVKFKWNGRLGSCEFEYDFKTGRYRIPGTEYENELEIYLANQAQAPIEFREPEPQREPGQLTDIGKLTTSNSFAWEPSNEDAPF